jgi:plastocyanin
MRRALCIFCMVALSGCAGTGMGSHLGVPNVPTSAFQTSRQSAHASTNWSVETGGTEDKYALQDLDFYPNKIVIDAGDTITFQVAGGAGGDAHTVSFVPLGQKIPNPNDPKDLNPAGGTTVDGRKFVNSGILVGGQTFTLLFPRQGTYRILCLFHEPAMQFTVVVQTAGAPYPHHAGFYLTVGTAQKWHDLAAALGSVALFPFKPGGTKLAAGIDPGRVQYPPSDSTVLRYLDSGDGGKLATSGNLTIEVGTVVTWVNETSNEPHTLTLPKAGQKDLPSIPPDPPVNVVRHGITKYDGKQIVNSGTFLAGKSFQLQFTKVGKYLYGCLYHDNSGMEGTITVTP